MIKILHIIIGLNVGGAERSLQRLILAQKNDCEFTHKVVSLTSLGEIGKELIQANVEVVCLGMTLGLGLPIVFPKLISEISKYRPNVVQTWMYHADLIGGVAAKVLGKKIIWSVRNTHAVAGRGTSRATFYVMRFCALLSRFIPHKIICVAHAAVTTHKRYGYFPGKMHVIGNGYDVDKINFLGGLSVDVNHIFDEQDELRICSIGRYNEYKDFPTLIAAASLILKRAPRVKFYLIGRNLDRNNIELNRLIEDTGRSDAFMLLGERSDVLALLKKMDIFCLHSVSEGFPNVLAEAMALGVSSVTTNVGDAALILGTEFSNYVVEPQNPAALAKAVLAVIDLKPSQRRDIGLAHQDRIREYYSLEAVTRSYKQIYEEVVKL